ncbi:hypothetical protein HID58_095227 [Brassica napus]|uniref:Uncharacterized protein n=1 Tax=Brassica napus TaxID=3708 RepID=A0ABQ7X4D2_BRANA|nr:hypothetical protein HID58_095227 [Brassica napus]
MVTISSLFKILSCTDHVDYAIINSDQLSYPLLYGISALRKSKRQPHPLPPGPGVSNNRKPTAPQTELHNYFQGLAKEHGPISNSGSAPNWRLWLAPLRWPGRFYEPTTSFSRTDDVPAVALINTYGGD